jgi:hypothetical protein
MSLDSGRYQLYSSFKTVREHWADAVQHWQDTVRQEFEEQHWGQLEPRVQAALAAIDRLALVINQAKQECRS